MGSEPTDRSRRVLAALVREYIASGEPVASSLLVTAAGLGISSATVRHILAHLEAEGFVQQPHTSAGRIPTDRGYRFYVDLLLDGKRPRRLPGAAVEARLRREAGGEIDAVLAQVSHLIAQASRGVGFAVAPAHEAAVFDRVEFVSISRSRVLVVIIARGGHVMQKVIEVDEPLTPDELRSAAAYLNGEFSGLPLARAREAVLERLQAEQHLYDTLLTRAIRLASSTFTDLPSGDVLHVEGAATLVGDGHGLTLDTLRALVAMIEQKQRLVALLNEYIDGPGLTVVIGAEHPDPNLRSFSLVASTYDHGGRFGTIGVIGPTRMRYSRAIAVVDGAAHAVSRVLREPV